MPKHLLELNVIEAKDLVNADSGPTQGKGMKISKIFGTKFIWSKII